MISEPAFKALRELLPNVGAIGANSSAPSPRSGSKRFQIDIAPYNFNFVQTLKGGKGCFRRVCNYPDTGAAGWETSLHLVAERGRSRIWR